MFFNNREIKVSNIDDLKSAYRKERKTRLVEYIAIVPIAILSYYLFRTTTITILYMLVIHLLIHSFQFVDAIRALKKLPQLNEVPDGRSGNFTPEEIVNHVDDAKRKLNTKREFDIRIIPDLQSQAFTSCERYKRFFKNKNILAFHEGLLRTLSEPELKAIVAHEIGHHLIPSNASNILGEYWADFYACKFINPVAMANALIKLDQNNFLLNVFMQRCVYIANTRMNPKFINEEFWSYMVENATLPFRSKREANKLAKKLVISFEAENNLPKPKRNLISNAYFYIRNKLTGDILDRKKLAEVRYVNWETYDTRIRNNYLDKYELLELLEVIRSKKKTVSRFHFYDIDDATHPNTNRRLVFIIENFLLGNN